ncbi:MAG: metalloregulator ArsR/SmtB family transcription factor [Eubacteriales bacterium]|nr:metalloregulator ArsR/SmtB family transcription factor [Eubacteriales bacterium]
MAGIPTTPQSDYIYVHADIVDRVTAMMPDEDTLFDLSELFKLFGDSTRIKILYCLFVNEMCVCDIANLLRMSQSAISHQLAALKRSKLVYARRKGKTIFYALADDHVRTILGQGIDHVTE